MKKRLDSSRVLQMPTKSVGVNIAKGEPIIGLQVEPQAGATFVIPLTFECARDLANMILQTLMCAAPEMFFAADVAQQFRPGELPLEQLKELV
jgi:hypothetical protein